MPVNYRKSHAMGLHKETPNKACTLCTQERDAAAMREAHANGQHEKLPRQKCPACKEARVAAFARC